MLEIEFTTKQKDDILRVYFDINHILELRNTKIGWPAMRNRCYAYWLIHGDSEKTIAIFGRNWYLRTMAERSTSWCAAIADDIAELQAKMTPVIFADYVTMREMHTALLETLGLPVDYKNLKKSRSMIVKILGEPTHQSSQIQYYHKKALSDLQKFLMDHLQVGGRMMPTKHCVTCGNEFIAERSAITCSPDCSAERKRTRDNITQRSKWANDPEYRQRRAKYQRDRYRHDPAFRRRKQK